jgi:F-type H+-transporting ATPase subunit delta
MSTYKVSTRYSKAFFEQSESKGSLEETARSIEIVFNTLDKSKELRNLLKSPIINADKKISIISELFRSKISSDSLNFLNFVISKDRADMLFDILKRFLTLRDEKLGIVNVDVTSAVDISESQAEILESNLAKFVNKKVKVKYSTNNNLIGGFIAKVGDTLIDASVKNQLRVLKKQLLK